MPESKRRLRVWIRRLTMIAAGLLLTVAAQHVESRPPSRAILAAVADSGRPAEGIARDPARRPADPHTARSNDPSISGHTDKFAIRFRRP